MELGEALGAELKFNDENMCELAVGESTVLSIERRPDAGTLLMTSVVADALPDPVDYSLVLDLLDFSLGAALNGTPAIGRDEVSGLVVAHQTVTAQDLKDASFGTRGGAPDGDGPGPQGCVVFGHRGKVPQLPRGHGEEAFDVRGARLTGTGKEGDASCLSTYR